MITDEFDAHAEFDRLCNPTECPTLNDVEVEGILDSCRRGSVWAAATAYNVGDVVIPTAANRNGRRFRALRFTNTDRKTGSTEPAWSTSDMTTITDGSVIWQEDGSDWDGALWDLQAAAREGWELKASKAVTSVDVSAGQVSSIKGSQLYDHCLSQAKRFQSVYVL